MAMLRMKPRMDSNKREFSEIRSVGSAVALVASKRSEDGSTAVFGVPPKTSQFVSFLSERVARRTPQRPGRSLLPKHRDRQETSTNEIRRRGLRPCGSTGGSDYVRGAHAPRVLQSAPPPTASAPPTRSGEDTQMWPARAPTTTRAGACAPRAESMDGMKNNDFRNHRPESRNIKAARQTEQQKSWTAFRGLRRPTDLG
jgi:hypothetical protein